MIEEQLDLLDQIKREISNLAFEIESNNSPNENIQWIILELHELLDKILLT